MSHYFIGNNLNDRVIKSNLFGEGEVRKDSQAEDRCVGIDGI